MSLRLMIPALALAALVSGCATYGGADVGYAGPAAGPQPGPGGYWVRQATIGVAADAASPAADGDL